MKIGFIGLGHMGLPMAKNLLKAGFVVTGFDLEQKALTLFSDAGGLIANSLETLAMDQDILITMLQTGQQVENVCIGKDRLLENAKKSALHIDCSTIDVQSSRKIHHQADTLKLLSVDAPVSGGVAGASAGTLTFMVGGTISAFNKAQPILSHMGKKIIYTGDAGSGQASKICNNMMLGISMIAVSEAFVLGEKLGLTPQKLHEVVTNASGKCWVTEHYVPVAGILPNVPANNNYEPGFTAAMMLKDLLLSQQSSKDVNLSTPMGNLATELYLKATEAGIRDLDFSAIIKSYS